MFDQSVVDGLNREIFILLLKSVERLPKLVVVSLAVRYVLNVANNATPGEVRRVYPQHLLVYGLVSFIRTGTAYEIPQVLFPTCLAHPFLFITVELAVDLTAI